MRSRKAALDQDFCFDGLSQEQVRCLALRIKAELKDFGLEPAASWARASCCWAPSCSSEWGHDSTCP
jgi:hypothetical protein